MTALWAGHHPLDAAGLLALFGHFMLLSLLAIGGAITTVGDMQRFIVRDKGWLGDADFTASIALAQAAPGPNVLFVAVVGFNVSGLAGAAAALAGSLLPSTTLALMASRLLERARGSRAVRAFTDGLAPLTLGLLLATAWVMLLPLMQHWATPALVAATLAVMLRTRASPLWPIALGAATGALGGLG